MPHIILAFVAIGESTLTLPIIRWMQLHATLSSGVTYAYEFPNKRLAPPRWYDGPDWLRTGADHSDEIVYVFGLTYLLDISKAARALLDIDIVC